MPRPNPTPGDSYYLDPSLERIVVTMCASRPSFWGRMGHELEPDCMGLEPAKRILRACRQIDRETKRPPESPVLVLQLMRQWLDEGKADGNLSLIKECAVIFDDALDTGLLHDDAAVARLKPILARRLKDQAVIQAIDEQGKDGDFARVIKLIDKANSLGDVATTNTLVRLSDVKPSRVGWLWRDRVPLAKLSIIDGNPGTGKSTVTMDLAARLTTGAPMPFEHEGDEPADVVIVSTEDGVGDTIAPRLLAAGGDAGRAHVLLAHPSQEPSLSDSRYLASLEAAVRDNGAKLVILDPLTALLGGRVDSHKDADVRRVLAPLAAMAERTGAAVLGVRHLAKTSAERSALTAGLGSIAVIGAARSGMVVAVDPENKSRRVLAAVKSNVARLAKSLRFEIEERCDDEWKATRINWLGECDVEADDLVAAGGRRGRSDEVVAWLDGQLENGAMAADDIEELGREAGFTKKQLDRAKSKLGVTSRRYGQPGDQNAGWLWERPCRN